MRLTNARIIIIIIIITEIHATSIGRFDKLIFIVYFTVFILSIAFRLYVTQWRRKQFGSGGAQCRREAPAENFLMCPLTFLL